MQEFERQKIADAMEPKKFEDGDMIIEQVIFPECTSKCSFGNFSALKMTSSALIIVTFQGDTKTDYFYFVMDGEVRFTIRDESGEEQEIKVRI